MGSTDRITPHVFQDSYLATDSSIVDGRPQRTEIVVIANAFELHPFAVQEEPFALSNFDGANAESRRVLVFQHIAFIYF